MVALLMLVGASLLLLPGVFLARDRGVLEAVVIAGVIGIALSAAVVAALRSSWVSGVVSMLPVTIAGIGTRELALTAPLAPFGAPPGRIVATAVAWHAVMVSGSLAGGIVWKVPGWAGKPPAGGRKRS